jgi:hypothetical protein
MGEADTTRGVWLAALAVIWRYPLAVLAPAMVLGALGEVPAYLMEGRPLPDPHPGDRPAGDPKDVAVHALVAGHARDP